MWLYSAGLGAGLLGFLTIACGWIIPGSLAFKLKVIQTLSWICVAAYLLQRRIFVQSFTFKTPNPFTLFETICFSLVLGGMAVSLLSAFAPITYYDSLVYHLALPAIYLRQDAITAVPFNLYSCFPAATEMLYLFIMARFKEAEPIINLLNWATSFAVGSGIYLWVKEIQNRKTGFIGLALWWTMPAVILLSVGGYIDLTLAFYSLLTVRAFLQARKNEWDNKWLYLAGLFGGMACATKYTGAAVPFLLSLFLIRHPLKLFIFISTVTIPFLPWLIKNAVLVGNPFFPFFFSWFGGDVGWTQASAAGYFQMLTEYGAKSNVLVEFLSVFKHITIDPLKFGGGFDVLGDFGWPLFIFGSILCFFLTPKHKLLFPIGIVLFGQFIIWFLSKPVLRFLLPALPLAAILSSVSLSYVLTHSKRFYRTIGFVLVIPWLCSNFFLTFFIHHQFKSFAVPLGLEDKQTFLNQRLAFYPMFDFLNKTLTAQNRIYLIGEQRTYHLTIPLVNTNFFAPSPFSALFNSEKTGPRIHEAMKTARITHILIAENELRRMGGLGQMGFTTEGQERFQSYLKNNCSFEKSVQQHALYKIKS